MDRGAVGPPVVVHDGCGFGHRLPRSVPAVARRVAVCGRHRWRERSVSVRPTRPNVRCRVGPGQEVHDGTAARRTRLTGAGPATVVHDPTRCHGELLLRFDAPVRSGARALVVGNYRTRGVIHVVHARVVHSSVSLRFRLRGAIAHRLGALYGVRAGVVNALVLAHRDDLAPELREDFVRAGIAHLLAISGLHVGILAGWIIALSQVVGLRRQALPLAAMLTWAYVGLLGFPAAATRAASFITIYVVARQRQRHPSPSAVLAVAALAIVVVDESSVRAVGAWLSVTAVWATGYGQRHLPPRWRRHSIAKLMASSAAATIATAPITAFAFGSVAPVGVLTNLVAIPLASLVVPAVLASLIIGAPLAAGAGLGLAGIEHTARIAAAVPGGHLTMEAGARFALPWLFVVGAMYWLLGRRPRWQALLVRLAAAAAIVTWGGLAHASWVTRGHQPRLTIHVLDVGQGDALAIRTPGGRWVVVDAGPIRSGSNAGRRVVLPFLRRQGAKRVDLLVVSHGDADHLGGAPVVTATFAPRIVLEPGQPLTTALYQEHLAAVEMAGASWIAGRGGDTLEIDGVEFAVLHPTADWVSGQFSPNENSLVVTVRYGCFEALLTGDIGHSVEEAHAGTWGPVDVLKVAHHGSRGSTSVAFLDQVRPAVAVISVGRNRYGHPSSEVLAALRHRSIAVYRTDQDGPVTLATDGRYLEVTTGIRGSFLGRIRQWAHTLSRSSSSFSSKSVSIPARPVTLPICSTTSP